MCLFKVFDLLTNAQMAYAIWEERSSPISTGLDYQVRIGLGGGVCLELLLGMGTGVLGLKLVVGELRSRYGDAR